MEIIILKGKGITKGKTSGKVKILKNPDDINKVSKNDIVVTNNNSPLFSAAFMKASGIISEKGAELCHLAIVAREMEKPCILNVENATEKLNDGTDIKMDSSGGLIETLDGEGDEWQNKKIMQNNR